MNFNNILIGSDDPERLVDYYTKLLGEPTMSEGGYTGWLIGSGFVSIGPHSEVHGKNAPPGRIIWNIQSDDVKGDFERFKAAGATVIREPYNFEEAPDSWVATFADPVSTATNQGLQFHVECFYFWDAEREAPGREKLVGLWMLALYRSGLLAPTGSGADSATYVIRANTWATSATITVSWETMTGRVSATRRRSSS